jgi:hypothetical protein
MNNVLHFDMQLKELEEKATDRLLMTDVFDEKAFAELFLASVLKASNAIRSRAEYLPDVKRHLKWADDFEIVLGLVAIGEAPSDRKPGAPKII